MQQSSRLTLAFFLLLCCIAYGQQNQPYIGSFRIVNVANSKVHRAVTDYDVIAADYPWTLITETIGKEPVNNITYFSPVKVTRYGTPYPITGFKQGGGYKPIGLKPGQYSVAAYTNNNKGFKTKRSFFYDPALPNQGPLPTEIKPSPIKGENEVGIPKSKDTCSRMQGLQITKLNVYDSVYDSNALDISFTVKWCPDDNEVRVRIIKFERIKGPKGNLVTKTGVLLQEKRDYLQYGTNTILYKQCESFFFFVEVCTKNRKGKVLCVTSPLKKAPRRPVPEPRLKFRPPTKLELAPGDSVKIKTVIVDVPWGSNVAEGYSNGGFDHHGFPFALQGTVKSVDGKTKNTNWTTGSSVSLSLNKLGMMYNGAVAFARYASASCPQSSQTWKARYGTKIIVNKKISSLVKQDTSLPSFKTPVYPETHFGEMVTLKVKATNEGGGKRKDGSKTKLTYQWFLRDIDSLMATRTYAEPILGETRNSISIKATRCSSGINCSRWGCYDLGILFVEVCNTFGCKRSAPIIPKLKPPRIIPEGMKWNEYICEFEDVRN